MTWHLACALTGPSGLAHLAAQLAAFAQRSAHACVAGLEAMGPLPAESLTRMPSPAGPAATQAHLTTALEQACSHSPKFPEGPHLVVCSICTRSML